jgi:aminomethyltransferase
MPQRTPLYDWHVARGAHMVEFAGWDMPIRYGTITEEHTAVRTDAGLFDISHMGRLVFEGPDALGLIQHLYTNDASAMEVGDVRYGLVCNEQGGILDDVLVYRFEPFWLMVVNASNRPKIVAWIEKHRGKRNVAVTDRTADWAMIAVQGPRALERVGPLYPTAGNLAYYTAELLTSDGPRSTILSRTGYTGEDGFEVILPAAKVRDEVERLQPCRPCGLGARDTLRLEAAMPLYGHELSEDIDPFQARLGWAVKMGKGDFVGREALARRKQDRSLRQRVGLELQGKRIAREGAAVLAGGKPAGQVTSGTFAPTLNRAVAMAYVDPPLAQPGTACEVDVRGKPEAARVVPLPFYKRPKT